MHALFNAVAAFGVWAVYLVFEWQACAALGSGIYETLPGATVEERGDRVPNGSRVVGLSATLTIDLGTAPPSLTAAIRNAVLEGGDPFALTVRIVFPLNITRET